MRKIILALCVLSLGACSDLSLSDLTPSSCMLGGIAGAGIGALLGSQFGESSGKTLATGVGAVLGSAGGYAAANAASSCS
jgi:uncharacterized protein YcfJ